MTIPLHDPRRSQRGNRTVRTPKSAWLRLLNEPVCDPHKMARGICRVYWLEPRRSDVTAVIAALVHGYSEPPIQRRKRFASTIRDMLRAIKLQREVQSRLLRSAKI